VWVHGNGPWTCTLVVNTATAVLATYRFTTQDPQN
jgi:hypothetical protein